MRAAQHRVDARQQLARRERLGDVVVGAAFEAGDLVALLGARGEHDDRQLARLAVALQRAGELQAAHVRQHPVDEHQVGPLVGERRAGRAAVLRLAHLEAGALQPEGDHLADRPLVLDDQNLFRGHAFSRLWLARVLQRRCVADS